MIKPLLWIPIIPMLLFAVILGPTYAWRYYGNSWTHGSNAVTGGWVGTLNAPKRGPAPDLSPSPFLSERNREETIRELAEQKSSDFASTRVVFVDTALDPFHLPSASLRGSAMMCDRDGTVIRYKFTTFHVGDDGLKLMLFNDTQSQFGEFNATFADAVLSATFRGFETPVSGDLKRGSKEDFEKVCANLRAPAH